MDELSKNAQVLKYFAQRCPGVGVTRLQKLAYMADLEARKLLGKPVSEFDYIWYTHGPFDKALYDAIDELKARGMANQRAEIYPNGYTANQLWDTGRATVLEFTPGELEIMNYVVAQFRDTPLQTLLDDVVYQTPPMLEAVKGEPLPFGMVDNIDRNQIGFDFERVLESENQAKRGEVVVASELLAEMLNDLKPADYQACA